MESTVAEIWGGHRLHENNPGYGERGKRVKLESLAWPYIYIYFFLTKQKR